MEFCLWDDRLGLKENYKKIMGNLLPVVTKFLLLNNRATLICGILKYLTWITFRYEQSAILPSSYTLLTSKFVVRKINGQGYILESGKYKS
jgi:hypothetical protein